MGDSTVCKLYQRVAFSHLNDGNGLFTRLRCKMWVCEYCAKRNQWEWRNWLIKRLPEVSDEWWILTLTAHSQTRRHAQSMDNIRKHLDAFFKRLKRVFGAIEYVRVFEKHPSSEAVHCHIVISGITPYVAVGQSVKLQAMAIGVLSRNSRNGVWAVKTWVKKTAQELHMGYICDIQKIVGDAVKAVWYVTKYLTKAQEQLHVKGLRHVQTTRGIGSPKYPENDFVWQTAVYLPRYEFSKGSVVTDLNTRAEIGDDYWASHSFYPYED